MEEIIYNNAPEYWERNHQKRIELPRNSKEFKQIEYEVKICLGNQNNEIASIERYQSVYDYGQFLIRGQLLAHMYSTNKYYKVRRFVKIRNQYLNTALDYNIDHRRCHLPRLVFQESLSGESLCCNDIILVVQVLTNSPYSSAIVPDNSSNYFIDYIIKF